MLNYMMNYPRHSFFNKNTEKILLNVHTQKSNTTPMVCAKIAIIAKGEQNSLQSAIIQPALYMLRVYARIVTLVSIIRERE